MKRHYLWSLLIIGAFWIGQLASSIPLLAEDSVNGDDRKAIETRILSLNTITGNDVIRGELRLLAKNENDAKKLIKVAYEMLKAAKASPSKDPNGPFNYTSALIIGRIAQEFKEVKIAEEFYRVCVDDAFRLQSPSKAVQSFENLIDLTFLSKKYEECIKICDEFLEIKTPNDARGDSPISRSKLFILERKVQALARDGKLNEAKDITRKLMEADEGGWYFYQLLAFVQQEEGKLDDAAETYLDCIERLRKSRNTALKKDSRDKIARMLRYKLSGVYVDLKKIDKATSQLESLVKEDPENSTYKNDLGYILADNNMKLDEAEKLVRQAIEIDRKKRKESDSADDDKDNASYLDSLGWVLFKQKKYEEAKKYLKEAVDQREGRHVEIYDHLAEVLLALKDKSGAENALKLALEADGQTKRDDDRKKEIKDKLKQLQK